ncbi:MAG: class I SAM-dependent methyltransferase [Candidatus Berkelbacteria bacterium]|nr:class I SAM-dependent methyltransferase [Candidatus Berkelbacteria bacterium]
MNNSSDDICRKLEKTYDKLGERYLESIEKLTPHYFDSFIKLLPKNGLILDVGCAGGRDSEKFVKAGFKVVGIETVDKFIRIARKRIPQAEFKKMNLMNLDLPKNLFDGIWANAVLLHIPKKEMPKVLRDLFEILKPEGRIYIAVKEGNCERLVEDKLSAGHKRFFSFFAQDEISKLVKQAGFEIIEIKLESDPAGRSEVSWIHLIAEK